MSKLAAMEHSITDCGTQERDEGTPFCKGKAKDWYALYTRHQHEKTVARSLEQKGFEVFLPLYQAVHQWKDRRKELFLPLLPCYVFFHGNTDRRLEILNTPGVRSLVCHGSQIAVIADSELEAVRRITAGRLPAEPCPFLQCGDRVRVRSGPLAGIEGILMRKRDSLRLVLTVELVFSSIAVEVDEARVERMSASRNNGSWSACMRQASV